MNKTKYASHLLYYIGIATVIFGCSKTEDLPAPLPEDRSITMAVRAENEGYVADESGSQYLVPAGPPVINFWQTSDPEKIGNEVSTLYGTVNFPNGTEASTYPEANKYPVTGLKYPADGSALTAVAYAPKQLIVENGGLRLRVPDGPAIGPEKPAGNDNDPYLTGHADIMTARAITGSGYLPFSKPLEFKHKQARVIFTAIKANTMTKIVRNVRIKVPYTGQLVDYLEWDAVNQDYMPVAFDNTNTVEHYFGQIWNGQGENPYDQLSTAQRENPDPTDDFRYIGTVYLTPGKNQVECTISGHIGNREDDDNLYEDEKFHYDFKQTIKFLDEQGRPLTLEAGDSYVIRLIFSDDMISVKAYYPQWQSGGDQPLPIKPGK